MTEHEGHELVHEPLSHEQSKYPFQYIWCNDVEEDCLRDILCWYCHNKLVLSYESDCVVQREDSGSSKTQIPH